MNHIILKAFSCRPVQRPPPRIGHEPRREGTTPGIPGTSTGIPQVPGRQPIPASSKDPASERKPIRQLGYPLCGEPRPNHLRPASRLFLVTTLVARLTQKLTVLLLRHPLAALLHNRTHKLPPVITTVAEPPERENNTLVHAGAKLLQIHDGDIRLCVCDVPAPLRP